MTAQCCVSETEKSRPLLTRLEARGSERRSANQMICHVSQRADESDLAAIARHTQFASLSPLDVCSRSPAMSNSSSPPRFDDLLVKHLFMPSIGGAREPLVTRCMPLSFESTFRSRFSCRVTESCFSQIKSTSMYQTFTYLYINCKVFDISRLKPGETETIC